MSTTTNAINTINAAAKELVEQGWNVDIKLGFSSAAPALALAASPATVVEEAPQTASFSSAGATTAQAPVFPVEARLAQVVGTTIELTETDRTSSGFAIAVSDDDAVLDARIGNLDEKSNPHALFVNVYPKSLGTDIHSSEEKARRYASPSLVEVLPVFLN